MPGKLVTRPGGRGSYEAAARQGHDFRYGGSERAALEHISWYFGRTYMYMYGPAGGMAGGGESSEKEGSSHGKPSRNKFTGFGRVKQRALGACRVARMSLAG